LRSILLIVVFASALNSASGADPIKLRPYPQKFTRFYRWSESAVPEALKRAPIPSPSRGANCAATTADGAIWVGTHAGLMRTDARADPVDRRQFFAGRRYLPDDEVLNIVPDSSTGVWVRTHTGVSHIELRLMTLEQKASTSKNACMSAMIGMAWSRRRF
jgi:ligand-binding sensor domain-containing protein